jgi:ketosteroid isomerase-like protein
MNRLFFVVAFLASLVLTLSGCTPIAPPASASGAQAATAAEVEQFKKAVMAAEEAFQSGDADRAMAFYADDAISNPPGYPTAVGKAALKANLAAFFDTYSMSRKFQLVAVDVTGDHATRQGEWTNILTPKAGGEPVTETGRCILGWKKVNGEWKVAWEIWNTYESPAKQ